MTVWRKSDRVFNVTRAIVAEAVRNVFKADSHYRNTIEHTKNCLFTTNVKPHWYVLGTNMSINLEDTNTGTLVTVQTKSQFFIYGDVFASYNRLIQGFLRSLNAEVQHWGTRHQYQAR